ncbi:uncharacterized protein LOC133199952 [Saccostrea echinata]|uniref:uncharacterized protein LOC133199952 n=1 Tax=Saccostrea echinata TaxID=191078 RepID=UPI002A829785|nr:uncharacterized protein LOC133199952 [Saccostrea echinata]
MSEGYAVKVPTEDKEHVDGKVCSLVGTLLRFRQEEIAVMGDIDNMFYQVCVPKQDASFLRFLWWEDGDTNKKIVEYQMVVHLFGASSSPSCANYALRKTARDSEGLFDSEIINTVFKNFYVDDCLKSIKTVDNATGLIKDVQRLLTRGGFHISKWISNNRDVMMSIPISERAKEVKGLDLDYDALPIERALGVQWCVESDVFCFNIEVNKKPLTRRGILSMISSVFDPWFCDLQKLSEFKIDRCVKPIGFGTVCFAQLHHFADASELGYGTVSYLRLENVNNDVHCSFIMGKSRVAPLKQTSIPRLEMTAATVAVRTNKMLKVELDIPIDETVFWTDSMAELRYIRNKTSRFHTFVANRLAVIHEGSTPQEWRYINTKLNPADHASRGLSAKEIVQHGRWIQAPEFLRNSDYWPETPTENLRETLDDDPEVKKVSVRAILADVPKAEPSVELMGVEKLINYHSSWYMLRKSVAWILKIRTELLRRIQQNKLANSDNLSPNEKVRSTPDDSGHISLQDLQKAEITILCYVQHQTFCDELSTLAEGNTHVKRNSYVRKLDPVLDEDGLLRVGGRLQRANMPTECKHPFILPKNHHISTLILRQIHEDLKHSDKNHMMAVLREKYWLVHAASAIRKLISKCTICRRQGSSVGEQKMANLPEDRLIPDEPPFTRRNIDWKFNPPAGSHHGGVWERIIRSVRKVLNNVLREQVLDDEGIHTLMCEIESILNGRPITRCSDQHVDLEALTPNHLLLMKTKPNLPPGVFVKEHNYCRRRWKQIQYMANLFWKRWTREYLPLLQERHKWFEEKRNFKVGDVVLVVDSNAPRNSWPMGIIEETLPDDKGFLRQVRVKTSTNNLIRPVDKLCLILEMD